MNTILTRIPTLLVAASLLIVASCRKIPVEEAGRGNIVYVISNDYHANQNAVLAYLRKSNGELEPLPGSPFYTHGAGIGNPMEILGPDDSDSPLILSPDGHYLLAVNSGSNTIAVFSIERDGSLSAVPGSPFASGGQTPVSLAIAGQYLYVVNKAQDPLHTITENPSYVTFNISPSGWVDPKPVARFETTVGSSPAQALVSQDQSFLFGTDFLAFQLTKLNVGSLRSFAINGSGSLTPAPGTPQVIPGAGGALGLWQHPNSQVLYAGFPVQSAVGVYAIDPATGALSFQTSVAAGAAACWLRTNKTGDRLYVLNSGENSVSIFNTSSALSPVFMSKIVLKDSGPLYGAGKSSTSEDFGLGFSPSGNYLYVVSQHTNPDFTIGSFNYLHELPVSADGSLTEPTEPIHLPVAADVRPEGVVVN